MSETVTQRGGDTERERDLALAARLLAWADDLRAELAAFRARLDRDALSAPPQPGTFPPQRRNSP